MRCQVFDSLFSLVLISAFALAVPVIEREPVTQPGEPLLEGFDLITPDRELSQLELELQANPELIHPSRTHDTIFEGFDFTDSDTDSEFENIF